MQGCVYHRGKTWTFVIDVGLDAAGKRRQRSKGGFRTKKEAQAALTEALTALQRGSYTEPSRLSLGRFLEEQWLPASRARVRPSTFASYSMHVRRHLVPGLGSIPLQKLTAPAINAFYADLRSPPDGSPALSPASVRRVHATLHRSLADATRWQLVPRNAAASADPPRAPRPEMAVWSVAELRGFLHVVAEDRQYSLWLFYALTGVRRGEALALRWADLDLERRRATIRRTLVPVDHELIFGEPKTDRARRSIALDPDLVSALRANRKQQREERLLLGPAYIDQDLVFARPDGSPLHPERVSRLFARLSRRAGLPPIRLHDLRHTHATLALVAGVPPRVLSDRLGHSAMAVTADIYQHVIPDLEDDAALRVARLVFAPPAQVDASPAGE